MRGRIHSRQVASRPLCGAGGSQPDYNLGLHIGAVFIIMGVSASACAFPLVVSKIRRVRLNLKFLFIVRHFGTGVLLATAFVHLLPTAFISLTDPCLPSFWNEDYPAMAGAIALCSVFLITTIEMVFSPGRHCSANVESISGAERGEEKQGKKIVEQSVNFAQVPEEAQTYGAGHSIIGRSHSNGRRFAQIATERNRNSADDIVTTTEDRLPSGTTRRRNSVASTYSASGKEAIEERKKALMQCVMLEVGILFHSVFIGMALAVATGREQIILLIAIVFHQTFEGLALGSRIATIEWSKTAMQPWIMAMAYGCTTPIGQAIGIGTRNLYSPDSETGLLVVGIMNAISSGLLTFNSLIDLLGEDFLSDQSWKTLQGTRRIVAFSLVFFGAFCMALIGAWA